MDRQPLPRGPIQRLDQTAWRPCPKIWLQRDHRCRPPKARTLAVSLISPWALVYGCAHARLISRFRVLWPCRLRFSGQSKARRGIYSAQTSTRQSVCRVYRLGSLRRRLSQQTPLELVKIPQSVASLECLTVHDGPASNRGTQSATSLGLTSACSSLALGICPPQSCPNATAQTMPDAPPGGDASAAVEVVL